LVTNFYSLQSLVTKESSFKFWKGNGNSQQEKRDQKIYGNEIKWNKIYFLKNVKWYFSNVYFYFYFFLWKNLDHGAWKSLASPSYLKFKRLEFFFNIILWIFGGFLKIADFLDFFFWNSQNQKIRKTNQRKKKTWTQIDIIF